MCFNASEEGILDGQSPQASAAASIILISTIRSIFNKKFAANLCALNVPNSSSSKRPQIELFRAEKDDVDIQTTVDAALASLTTVKRAYTSLLLSITLVIPIDMKEKIMKSLSSREAECWHSELPTFDVLLKLLKAKLQGEDKEKEKNRLDRLIRLENNKRIKLIKVKEEEIKRQRVRELNIVTTNPLIKTEIKTEIKNESQKSIAHIDSVSSSSSNRISHIANDKNSTSAENSSVSDTSLILNSALSIIKIEKGRGSSNEIKVEVECTSKIEIENECSGVIKIEKENENENGLQQTDKKKESSPSSHVMIKKEIEWKRNCKATDPHITSEEKCEPGNSIESCNKSRQKMKFAADSDDLLGARCPGNRSRKMQRIGS